MTYHYEMLGPDRFQKFAQSILTTCFPHVQCLPLYQADGGRDAFVRGKTDDQFLIFQVKFVLDQNSKNERQFLRDLIRSEKDKVIRLFSAGASAYYVITNMKGTAGLGVGSIDSHNQELSDAFGMAAHCWWRDDLDARVAASQDIRFAFPEILKGNDVLSLLVTGGFEEYLRFKQLVGTLGIEPNSKPPNIPADKTSLPNRIDVEDNGHGPVIKARILSIVRERDTKQKEESSKVRLLIDTGASTSCIDRAIAQDLNLPLIDQLAVQSPSGVTYLNVYCAEVEITSADGSRRRNQTVRLFGIENIRSTGIDGLIGREIMKDYRLIYGPEGVTFEFASP